MRLIYVAVFSLFLAVISFALPACAEGVDQSIVATLPPDPGAAGKETLAGIDSDNDGVRDDVQRWIVMTYPNSQKTRAGLIQRAKTMQEILLNAEDAVRSVSNVKQMIRDTDCLEFVSPNAYYEGAIGLKAMLLNNRVRSMVWLQANTHLSGNVFTSLGDNDLRQGCNFDPDAMPN